MTINEKGCKHDQFESQQEYLITKHTRIQCLTRQIDIVGL